MTALIPAQSMSFHVTGSPVPQGSKRWVGTRMIESAAALLKPWRQAVAASAQVAARRTNWVKVDGPIHLQVEFTFLRPPSVPKRRWLPDRKPDIDKIVRAVMDGITDSNSVWADDARVTWLETQKWYAEPGEMPGAWISIEPIARGRQVRLHDAVVQGR